MPTVILPAAPIWLIEARRFDGLREIVGKKHSPVIMSWAQELGAKVLGIKVNDDETPWCGLFMAWIMHLCGLSSPLIAVRASQWGRGGKWGRELLAPRYGCIMVFTRQGGGHVGLYVGETKTHYAVYGGNTQNKVGVAMIAKDRLAEGGMRWPKGPFLPAPQIIMVNASGIPVSTNEG